MRHFCNWDFPPKREMEFIDYLLANGVKCRHPTEVMVQTRLLYNLFHGLMSVEDVNTRPLAAQAMTPAERLDYEDLFERKRIMLYAKSKVATVFPTLSLMEFLNLPRQYMEHIVKVASEVFRQEASQENAQAEQLLKGLGLEASKNYQGSKP